MFHVLLSPAPVVSVTSSLQGERQSAVVETAVAKSGAQTPVLELLPSVTACSYSQLQCRESILFPLQEFIEQCQTETVRPTRAYLFSGINRGT